MRVWGCEGVGVWGVCRSTPTPAHPVPFEYQFSYQFKNNYFTEMCSGSEAGSYLRLIDFVHVERKGVTTVE